MKGNTNGFVEFLAMVLSQQYLQHHIKSIQPLYYSIQVKVILLEMLLNLNNTKKKDVSIMNCFVLRSL